MKVKTKLNINDDIFYMAQNKVQQEKVKNITINLVSSKVIASHFETHILYITNFDVTVNEKFAFGTKQELLDSHNWQSASEMTKEQSRYILKCLNVNVIRIQDIETNANILRPLGVSWHTPKSYEGRCKNMRCAIKNFYESYMTEIGYNKSYEDNDYLFLFEFKIKGIK